MALSCGVMLLLWSCGEQPARSIGEHDPGGGDDDGDGVVSDVGAGVGPVARGDLALPWDSGGATGSGSVAGSLEGLLVRLGSITAPGSLLPDGPTLLAMLREAGERPGAELGGAEVPPLPGGDRLDPGPGLGAPPEITHCGRLTGGGSVLEGTSSEARVTHGFELHCNAATSPNLLQVSWQEGGVTRAFHLEELVSAFCFDDPEVNAGHPEAGFDTLSAEGTGRLRDGSGPWEAGYSVRLEIVDDGEPGRTDTLHLHISGPSGTVLTVDGVLELGDHQAHAGTGPGCGCPDQTDGCQAD